MKKQFRYALGEVLIVIIGITIAFSMNKCADDSKTQKERNQYLTNLKNDLEADKALLLKNAEEIQTKINDASAILPHLNTDSPAKMSMVNKVFGIMNLTNFKAKDITYQTLINSGDLKLIDDFDLKAAIETHYSSYEEMMKSYVRQESIVRDYGGHYLIYNADYDNLGKGEFPFTDEKLLKNIVQGMRGSLVLKKEATQRGIESCDHLIQVLQEVL